jgi:hypothetical protein
MFQIKVVDFVGIYFRVSQSVVYAPPVVRQQLFNGTQT